MVVAALTLVLSVACATEDKPPSQAKGRRSVPLEVFSDVAGGPLLFVKVRIGGEGPFRFGVDTAASQTVVDLPLAKRLDLDVVGRRKIGAATGNSRALEVAIERWETTGGVQLPPLNVVAFDLHGPKGEQGLLGADVFESFGSIVIDYESRQLSFGPR